MTLHIFTISTEHVTLNLLVEHHEGFWSARWHVGGLSGQRLPALAASGLSPSPCFTLKVTAATASPASSRGRVRPSHCGASSRGGAQLCCNASMKVNACSHLWLSWAGGTLLGKMKYCVTQRWEEVKYSYRVCPCAVPFELDLSNL